MTTPTADTPALAAAPGVRFNPFQPRNAGFWVLWPAVAVGVFLFIERASSVASYYTAALVVAMIVFSLYGLLFWWFTQRVDRYSAIPWTLITTGFLWGGFAATWVVAQPANDALLEIYKKLAGQSWFREWGPALTAPFTEELAKGAGLLLLIALGGRFIRTAFDGFVVGAYIGLGFQLFENVEYMSNAFGSTFGADPLASGMATLVMRAAVGFTSHILYSAVFCAGVVYAVGRSREPRRLGLGIFLMIGAMAVHGLWDGGLLGVLTYLGAPTLLTALSIPLGMVLCILLLLYTFRITVGNERAMARDVLEPEIRTGSMSAELADALCGTRKDRRQFRREGRSRRESRNELEAGFDLLRALERADGATTPEVAHARAEIARLQATNRSA